MFMKYIDNMPIKSFMVFGSIIIAFIIFFNYFSTLNNYFLDDTFYQIDPHLFHKIPLFDYILHSPKNICFSRPISYLSWAYNYDIFGPNPLPYHLIMVFLHILNSVLFFSFIQYTAKNRFFSLFTGIIFAIHPISSEAVTRLMSRDDIFCMIFYLASMMSFALTRRNRIYYILSLAFFIFSLLCKETALVLPFMIVVYDLLFSRRNTNSENITANRLKRYAPYFIILFIYIISKLISPQYGIYGYLVRGHPPFYWIFKNHGLLKGSLIYLGRAVYLPYKFFLFPVNGFVFKDYMTPIKILILLIFCAPILITSILNFKKFFNKITVFGFLFVFFNVLPVCFLLDSIDWNKGGLVNSRYLYTAAGGFSIIMANCLYYITFKLVKRGLIFCVILLYTIFLAGNNYAFYAASETVYQISMQTKKLHPLSPGDKKIFYFIPSADELYFCKGVYLFLNTGLSTSLSIAYGFPIEAYIIDRDRFLRHRLNSTIPSVKGSSSFLDREGHVQENFNIKKAVLDGYILKWDPEKNKVVDITKEFLPSENLGG